MWWNRLRSVMEKNQKDRSKRKTRKTKQTKNETAVFMKSTHVWYGITFFSLIFSQYGCFGRCEPYTEKGQTHWAHALVRFVCVRGRGRERESRHIYWVYAYITFGYDLLSLYYSYAQCTLYSSIYIFFSLSFALLLEFMVWRSQRLRVLMPHICVNWMK